MRAPPITFGRAKSLRRSMTLPEVILWQQLRGRRLGKHRFRRQHPIGPYIIDFYCPSAQLAVEIDGSAHDNPDQAQHDMVRDLWLRENGIRVLRVPAKDILTPSRLEFVLLTIEAAATPSTA